MALVKQIVLNIFRKVQILPPTHPKKKNEKQKEKKARNTFLIGIEEIKVMTAIRLFGKINWPFGLLISEQTWYDRVS